MHIPTWGPAARSRQRRRAPARRHAHGHARPRHARWASGRERIAIAYPGTFILTVGCALVTVVIIYGHCGPPHGQGSCRGVPGNSLGQGQGFTSGVPGSSTLTHASSGGLRCSVGYRRRCCRRPSEHKINVVWDPSSRCTRVFLRQSHSASPTVVKDGNRPKRCLWEGIVIFYRHSTRVDVDQSPVPVPYKSTDTRLSLHNFITRLPQVSPGTWKPRVAWEETSGPPHSHPTRRFISPLLERCPPRTRRSEPICAV